MVGDIENIYPEKKNYELLTVQMSDFVWHCLDWYILFWKESLAGMQCRL